MADSTNYELQNLQLTGIPLVGKKNGYLRLKLFERREVINAGSGSKVLSWNEACKQLRFGEAETHTDSASLTKREGLNDVTVLD